MPLHFGRFRWVVLPRRCPGEAALLELQERGAGRLVGTVFPI